MLSFKETRASSIFWQENMKKSCLENCLNSISDIIISNFLFCLINAEIDEVLLNFLIFGITLIDQKIRDVLIKPLFFLKKKVSLVNFIH